MKQKVIKAKSGSDMYEQIERALSYGWLVHSVTVNSETNMWITILYKEDE